MAEALREVEPSPAPQRWRWFDRPLRRDALFWYSLAMIPLGPLCWAGLAGVPIEVRRARRRRAAGLRGFESRRTPWILGCGALIGVVANVAFVFGVVQQRADAAGARAAATACVTVFSAFADGAPSDSSVDAAFRQSDGLTARAAAHDPRWQPLRDRLLALDSAWWTGSDAEYQDAAIAFDDWCRGAFGGT
ncbi:MAG TPA: hypothetical protein VNU01_11820, partial [Egibacteraceae bacterium]|nr:hypothetical protein [Egibacteraceae bacterium]